MKQIKKYKQRPTKRQLCDREHKNAEREIQQMITDEIDKLLLEQMRTGIKSPHLHPFTYTK